jgi:probable HAF family extracellular repeat protein
MNDPVVVIGCNGHAFILINGFYSDLGVLPGGDWSSASGINQSGTVVGDSSVSSGNFRGFVWNPQSGMVEIGTLGGLNSHATAINHSGEVVGHASLPSGYEHAFSAVGAIMTDLGTLGGSSYAYGINDSATIVGYSWPASSDNPHAFVYLNGIMIDLNSLIPSGAGWQLLEAYGINNSGQIVGEGLLNGKSHAFRLDPALVPGIRTISTTFSIASVPEPANKWVAAIGLVLVWVWTGARSPIRRHVTEAATSPESR